MTMLNPFAGPRHLASYCRPNQWCEESGRWVPAASVVYYGRTCYRCRGPRTSAQFTFCAACCSLPECENCGEPLEDCRDKGQGGYPCNPYSGGMSGDDWYTYRAEMGWCE